MAGEKLISPQLWASDDFIDIDEVPPVNGRYLWLYLLSSPASTSVPGLVLAGAAQIAEDIDPDLETWTPRAVADELDRLQEMGRLRWDRKHKAIWLPRALARPEYRGTPKHVKGWCRVVLERVSDRCEFKDDLIDAVRAKATELGPDQAEAAREALPPEQVSAEGSPMPFPPEPDAYPEASECHSDPSPVPSESHPDAIRKGSDKKEEGRRKKEEEPPNPPLAGGHSGLFALDAPDAPASPPLSPRPLSKAPGRKQPRARWFVEEAQRRSLSIEVDHVVDAYRQHHRQAKPGSIERGLIAERLIVDEFTAEELVEAVEGCHASAWHREKGHQALELIVRDSEHVERFRKLRDSEPPAAAEPVFKRWVPPAPAPDGPPVKRPPMPDVLRQPGADGTKAAS